MILVNLATELSISDLELRFGFSWKPSLRDSVMSFSHFFQSASLILYLLFLMFIVCWAKLIYIPIWQVDIRSKFFVWQLILQMCLVRTRSIMMEPFGWVNIFIPSLWTSRLCLLMRSVKISPFLLGVFALWSHAGCLALKSPNMIRGVSVWCSSSESSSWRILLLSGGTYMFHIIVCLLFIVRRFQIPSSLLLNKSSLKTFLCHF